MALGSLAYRITASGDEVKRREKGIIERSIDHVRVQLDEVRVEWYFTAVSFLRRTWTRGGWRRFFFFRFRMHQDKR